MNKLLEDYDKAIIGLEEYFEDPNFGDLIIQKNPDDYWQEDDHGVHWGTNEDDFDYYTEKSIVIRKEDITAVRTECDFGGDDFWNIFYSGKEVK